MKDETIAFENSYLPILGNSVGLYSWDLLANNFCGDAETARLFALDPAELAVGVTIERLIGCLHVEDRERIAKALHKAIIGGTLCRESYRIRLGKGQYRQLLTVQRCFGYWDGLPTTCSGFVCEIAPATSTLPTTPQDQDNVVKLRTAS